MLPIGRTIIAESTRGFSYSSVKKTCSIMTGFGRLFVRLWSAFLSDFGQTFCQTFCWSIPDVSSVAEKVVEGGRCLDGIMGGFIDSLLEVVISG